jgi:hypothetical protein
MFYGKLSVYYGTPDRIRTCDPLLRRQMLYPTELQAHIIAALFAGRTGGLSRNAGKLQALYENPDFSGQRATGMNRLRFSFFLPSLAASGRGAQTRTGGFLLPKQARYQLRHTPLQEILL